MTVMWFNHESNAELKERTPVGQVLERGETLKILGSSTLKSGGSPETRTRTHLRAADFESATSTIPSGSHKMKLNFRGPSSGCQLTT